MQLCLIRQHPRPQVAVCSASESVLVKCAEESEPDQQHGGVLLDLQNETNRLYLLFPTETRGNY